MYVYTYIYIYIYNTQQLTFLNRYEQKQHREVREPAGHAPEGVPAHHGAREPGRAARGAAGGAGLRQSRAWRGRSPGAVFKV